MLTAAWSPEDLKRGRYICAHGTLLGPKPMLTAIETGGVVGRPCLTAEEQAECELGTELFDELQDEVDNSFALHSVAGYRGVPGLVLVMRFARVEGQDFASGTKSIVLEGRLLRDGQITADFVAMRYTSNGAFGNYNRGFNPPAASLRMWSKSSPKMWVSGCGNRR